MPQVFHANAVAMNTATTGTGTLTVTTVLDIQHITPAQAGVVDGWTYAYKITDGNDIEFGNCVAGGLATTFTRLLKWSKIGGIFGVVNKINLSGNAVFRIIEAAEDIDAKLEASNARLKLTANLNLYVRSDGSDSNNGLANTSGSAWLTMQHAWDVLQSSYDLAGFVVTVNVAAGTYAAGVTAEGVVVGALGAVMPGGSGAIIFKGDPTTPSNVLVSPGGFLVNNFAELTVDGMKFSGGGSAIAARRKGTINFKNVNFGAASVGGIHIQADNLGFINAVGNYSVSGGGAGHIYCSGDSFVDLGPEGQANTITFTGTPNFTTATVTSTTLGYIQCPTAIFVGSATGLRHAATTGGIIMSGTDSVTFFPGNVNGVANTGGIYNTGVTPQPLDTDLTVIAGLTPTTDNFIQSKSGAWASRTVAQVRVDLFTPTNADGADLNTVTTPGPYTGNTQTNGPLTGAFFLEVVGNAGGDPNYILQRFTELGTTLPRYYMRARNAGTYGAWKQVTVT